MTELLFASAVALLLSPAPAPQSQPVSPAATARSQGPVEQELIALDKRFNDARRQGDTAFMSDLLTDDFVRVTDAANLASKADILKAMPSQAKTLPPDQGNVPTYKVQTYGDTAVMVHVDKADDTGPALVGMHVFVKQQGRWKMATWANVPGRPSAEQSINDGGYGLMEAGRLKEAIELFKTNVQLHPKSWNVYDSLGEAYAKAGDTALAIQNYEKSVQINPKNASGIAALAKLKGK